MIWTLMLALADEEGHFQWVDIAPFAPLEGEWCSGDNWKLKDA